MCGKDLSAWEERGRESEEGRHAKHCKFLSNTKSKFHHINTRTHMFVCEAKAVGGEGESVKTEKEPESGGKQKLTQ